MDYVSSLIQEFLYVKYSWQGQIHILIPLKTMSSRNKRDSFNIVFGFQEERRVKLINLTLCYFCATIGSSSLFIFISYLFIHLFILYVGCRSANNLREFVNPFFQVTMLGS